MTAEQAANTEPDHLRVVLEAGQLSPSPFTLLERKGAGHPDTMADHLAELLSRTYSRLTLAEVGAILHHNFDKLAILGGASEVTYGGGRMVEPIRVLVNGRATRTVGGRRIPVDEMLVDTVRRFLDERLPDVAGALKIELNVTSNPSPGAVRTAHTRSDRANWFSPESIDGLRERRVLFANDTSLGTGWAPENDVELFATELVDLFSTPSAFTKTRPWCGSDVKLMAFAHHDQLHAVMCVPQKSRHVVNREAYARNYDEVLGQAHALAAERLPSHRTHIRLNTRDDLDRDEVYLTLTGSSIESGDEGVVGRGNRVNGLITPLRPMNLEGASGKNPVYHVGKVYNLAARRIARRLHDQLGGQAEVHLASAAGQPLGSPWCVLVRMSRSDVAAAEVDDIVRRVLGQLPALTAEIVSGDTYLA